VTLTEKGLAVVEEAVTAGLAEQTRALGALDDTQCAQLADLLRQLLSGTERP